MINEVIVEFIWIGNQKVVWFSKFKENLKKASASALNHNCIS
jgi:hypothetical protein